MGPRIKKNEFNCNNNNRTLIPKKNNHIYQNLKKKKFKKVVKNSCSKYVLLEI